MQEWVSTLRSKLREMKIISPKENLYSRLPELKQPLLPTRDPMSPLPAPPPVPAAVVPGIEPIVPLNGIPPPDASQESHSESADSQTNLSSPVSPPCPGMSNTLTQNLLNMLSDPIVNLTNRLAAQQDDLPSTSADSHGPFIAPAPASPVSGTSTSSSASSTLARTFTANALNPDPRQAVSREDSTSGSCSSDSFKSRREILPLVIPRPHTTKPVVDPENVHHEDAANGNQSTTNITIIQVSDPVAEAAPGNASPAAGEERSFMANIEVNCAAGSPTTTQTVRVTSPTAGGGYDEIRNLETGVTNISVGAIFIQSSTSNTVVTPTTTYEQVFIGDRNNNQQSSTSGGPPMPYSVFLLSRQPRSASHVELTTPQRNRVQISAPVSETTPTPATPSRANVQSSNVSRTRKKTNANEAGESNGVPSEGTSADHTSRQRRGVAGQGDRKRSSSSSGDNRAPHPSGAPRILSSPRHPAAQVRPADVGRLGRISLREQQVVQLRREIAHPGGVRLQLRRKDCIGSIALVDAFNSVWIAGWRQKEHPMLYNALHIGDRLLSVGGIALAGSTSAADVHKVIRGNQSAYIELVVQRVPFGRVFAIKREMDGQCLGLIRESNTATVVDIIPNGLAARHGLPVKAKSCDGHSLTFWVLTEINGRPLNLFFKDNEIQDRLNAVGREISILVQPLDLVTKLRKQLKSMRGYKEFIVQ